MFIGSGGLRVNGATVFGSICGSGNSFNGSSFGVVRGVVVKSNGTFEIDGKEYKADEVTVRTEYKIKATGHAVYTEPNKLLVKILGDHVNVTASSQSGDLEIHCDQPCSVRSISTQSGNVRVTGDADNVHTMSGSVSVDGSVSGSVSTMSGDIRSSGRKPRSQRPQRPQRPRRSERSRSPETRPQPSRSRSRSRSVKQEK
jgi:hypothetical protein